MFAEDNQLPFTLFRTDCASESVHKTWLSQNPVKKDCRWWLLIRQFLTLVTVTDRKLSCSKRAKILNVCLRQKTWRQNEEKSRKRESSRSLKTCEYFFPRINIKIQLSYENFACQLKFSKSQSWSRRARNDVMSLQNSNAHLPTRKILIFLLIKSDVTEALLKMLFFELTDYTSPLDHSLLFCIKANFFVAKKWTFQTNTVVTSLNFSPSIFSIQKSRRVKPLNFPNF